MDDMSKECSQDFAYSGSFSEMSLASTDEKGNAGKSSGKRSGKRNGISKLIKNFTKHL